MSPVSPHPAPSVTEVAPRAATPLQPSSSLQHKASSSSISSDKIHQGNNELNECILHKYSRQILLDITGDRLPETAQETIQQILDSHAKGKPYGTEMLGRLYLKGDYGVPKDKKTAQTFFEQAASHGLAFSEFKVGKALLQQSPPLSFKAAEWLQRSSLHGFAKADYQLGMMHLKGAGDFPVDLFQAREFLAKAVAGGYEKAQDKLDNFDQQGMSSAPLPDLATTDHAAAAAQNDVDSFFRLGVLLANKDRTLSAMWLARAADRKHPAAIGELIKQKEQGFLPARRVLGLMHLQGRNGMSQDDFLASLYLAEPANSGDPEAALAMVKLHFENKAGLKRSDAIENTYLKYAARKYAIAQEALGIRYLQGIHGVPQDFRYAYIYLLKAASAGRSDAQYYLGNIYRDGLGGIKVTPEAASAWHARAAEQNNILLQHQTALELERHYSGTSEYTPEMRVWLLNRVQEGLPEAEYRLAEKLLSGNDGFATLPGNAREMLRRAANKDHAQAAYRLAQEMEHDDPPNHNEIRIHYLKAGELGHRQAYLKYGILLNQSNGDTPRIPNEAAMYLRKSLESGDSAALPIMEQLAEEKVPAALCTMAHIYLNGTHGKTKDPYKAFECFKQAATQNHIESKYQAALIYMHGLKENETGQSIPQNAAIANQLMDEAASGGYAPAQIQVALRHVGPDASLDDKKFGIKLLRAAAAQNNAEGLYFFGMAYGVEGDENGIMHHPGFSRTLRRKSAQLGYAPAQFSIARDHSKSEITGTSQADDKEAVYWHELAADQKYSDSLYELAMFHRQGRGGLAVDDTKVVECLRGAVEMEHPAALYEYALMLLNEKGGLKRDDEEALRFLRHSASKDYHPAKAFLEDDKFGERQHGESSLASN